MPLSIECAYYALAVALHRHEIGLKDTGSDSYRVIRPTRAKKGKKTKNSEGEKVFCKLCSSHNPAVIPSAGQECCQRSPYPVGRIFYRYVVGTLQKQVSVSVEKESLH